MPLFKRKDKTTIAELEEYYANQSKNRNGKAWFMALLSLLITLAVLAALFFGGRWLYRLVTNEDSSNVTTTSTTSGEQSGGVPSFGEIRTDSDTPNSEGDTATNSDSEGVVSDEAASTTRDVAGTTTETGTSNPPTSADQESDTIVSTTEIPNTGANELIALLPLIAFVAGYLYKRKQHLKKL